VCYWHWVDKNCLTWAQSYIITTFKAESPLGDFKADFEKVTGDCDLNQRKGQVINIFDMCVTGKWTLGEHKGSLTLPEFMHDTKLNELVLNLDIETSHKDNQKVKNTVREILMPLIKAHLDGFSRDLMLAHGKDVYISKEDMGQPKKAYNPKPPVEPMVEKAETNGTKVQKGGVVQIKQTITFQCAAKDLFECLIEKGRVTVWSRAPCEIKKEKNSPFSLFGGNITGFIVDWVDNESIEMKWRLQTWAPDHFSLVKITIKQGVDSTELNMVQEGVPVGEVSVVEGNWNNYFWNSIKRTFGYGVML